MILVDANLLLYAYDESSPHHGVARRWIEGVMVQPEPVRLAWVTVLAFVRISTNSRVFAAPYSAAEALEIVKEWFAMPHVAMLDPGVRHWEILGRMVVEAQATGPLVMDAHLAALALEHGAELCTSDRDFARFPGLRWRNPIQGMTPGT